MSTIESAVYRTVCQTVFKNTDAKELINMLQLIDAGEIPLSPGLAARLLTEFRNRVINRTG
jgi:two-component system NarL family response regulator